jgi:micrococcal nuclease
MCFVGKVIIVLLLAYSFVFVACEDSEPVESIDAFNELQESLYDVVRVVDGDTLIVNIEGVEERVRLIGVDTPESMHPDEGKNSPLGDIASEFTKNALEGCSVAIEIDVQDRDQYGRLLAYVYVDGIMFNKILLYEGMAQMATFPPNVKYVEEFKEIQKGAVEAGRGFWGE